MTRLTPISPIIARQRLIVFLSVCMLLFSGKLLAQPSITTISPISAAVGATITITGTNFNTTAASNLVFFGPVKTTAATADGTGTILTVTVPSGAGYGPLNVLNTGTGLSAYSRQLFMPVFSPNKPSLINADITRESIIASGTGSTVYSLATSDLNEDGKADLIMTTGNIDDRVYFRTNTSTGSTVSFGSTTNIAVPGGLSRTDVQLSVGDLDGDTRQDLVVPGKNASAFTILKNNGSMSFSSSIVSGAFSPTGSAIKDFDNDGKPDIAIAANTGLRAFVYPNTTIAPGAIAVGSAITLTASANVQNVFTADLDGDGRQDLIAPYGTWTDIGFFRNTSSVGTISFAGVQDVTVFSSGHAPDNVLINDLDGDNKPDLVITDGDLSTPLLTVLRNTSTIGSISFSVTTVSVPYIQSYASLGDVNGDGRADLLFNLMTDFDPSAGTDYRLGVMNNTSSGGSISFADIITIGSNSTHPLVGTNVVNDFNGDGRPDIIATHLNAGQISIYTSTPQFAPTITSFSPTVSAIGATMSITGTGFHTTPSQNTVFMGAARATVTGGTATTLTATIPTGSSHAPITVTNRTATLTGQSVQSFIPAFLPNKPTIALTDFTLQGTITPSGGSMYGMVAGDLNADGRPDIVETSNNRLNLLRNTSTTGTLSFTEDLSINLTALSVSSPRYPALGDLTGDGTLDIAVPVYGSDRVLVFANTGTITGFTLSGSFVTDARPNAAAIGDIDGDGKPDIVTSNESATSGSISVLRNTGTDINTISFATKVDAAVFSNTAAYTVTLADMDSDGKLDVITGDYTSSSGNSRISVFRNNSTPGTISFAARQDFSALNGVWAATAGDLNGDGKPDLVVSHATSSANSITVFRNTSTTGTISLDNTGLNFTIGRGQKIISLADMNGDSRLDVVASVQDPITSTIVGDYKIAVFPNTSSGGTLSLGTMILLPMTTVSHSIIATDFNTDGKPDIISGNDLSVPLTLYRNTLVAAPLVQASNLTATTLATSATISWTNGGGARHAVFVKVDNAGTAAPVNLTDYTADNTFGAGSQIGITGWYCVYDGTGTSVAITGLTPSTTYRAMVTDYNNGGFANNAYYQTAAATSNPLNFTARATLTSISRTVVNPVNTGTVTYTVTFGSAVSGLATTNFTLTTSGITGASVASVSGSGTSYTVTVNTGTGNGTIVLNLANTTGLTPNLTNTLPFAGESYTIDKTAPAVNTATVPSNGSYIPTQNLDFTVTFNEVVTVNTSGGTPSVNLTLNTGGTVAAGYVSGTGTNTILFRYTVVATNSDNNGITVNPAITLNGGTIKDAAGNDAASVLSLATTTGVLVDGVLPVATGLAKLTPSTANTNATTLVYRISFAEPVNGVDVSDFSLALTGSATGNIASVSASSGSTIDVTVNSVAGDGTIGLNLNTSGTAITDNAGNAISGGQTGELYTLDHTVPVLNTVTIVSSNANTAKAKTGDLITVSFTATETITTPTVLIATHTVTPINVSANIWSASYTMTGSDAAGTVPFSIAFADLVGNAGTNVSGTTNSSAVLFDRTVPSLSTVTVVSNHTDAGKAKTGNMVTLNFTANESITTPTVTIATHAVTVTNVSTNTWTASYTMTGSDAEGTVPFTIAFTDVTGNAGTNVSAATNNSAVLFDRTVPLLSTVTIVSNHTDAGKAKTGNLVTLNFTANESITTPTVTIATHAVTVTNVSANTWTASYTMTGSDAEGTVPFSIAFTDVTGNAGTTVSATTNSSAVLFDRTAPSLTTVTIVSNHTDAGKAKTGSLVTLNFTASETIITPVVTIATHAVTVTNVSANAWTASYTMTGSDAEGTVPFSIAFTDLTGNAGTNVSATTNSSTVLFDRTAPSLTTVTIGSNNTDAGKAKNGNLVTLNFTANESITTPTVTIATHAVTVTNVSANAWTASYTMTGSDAEGTVPFSIAFADVMGNAGATITAATNSSSVVFDKTLPVLTNVSITSGNLHPAWAKKADVVTLAFTSSETIGTPVVTLATHAVAVSNTGSNNWVASYTMASGDTEGAVPFSIAFADLASNTGIAVTGTTDNSKVVYDITAPVLQPVTISSNNAIAGIALPGNSVTLTMTANETILSPTVTIASHGVSATGNTGNAWSAAYTMIASDTEGQVSFSITAVDMAGNATAVNATTDNSKVNFRLSQGPFFTNGNSQTLSICQDIHTAINNLLRVTYLQTGKPLTITVTGMPSHGTLSGFDAAIVSNGSTVLPSGLGYKPAAGYSGADVFTTAMVTDGVFTSTTTVNVTVGATPSGSITATGGTALCEGATLVLTGNGGNSYKWYKDGVLINNNSTSQLTVTETGTYTAILVSAAGCEAAATGTITVTLIRKPQVDFTIGSNSCINIPVLFTNASVWTSSGTVNHLWNDGKGGTSTAISPSFTYTQTGSYSVKLKVTPQLCPALADSITKTVTITQALSGIRNPTMDIAKNEPTKLVIRTIPNASYQWSPSRFLLTTNVSDPVTIASAEQEYQIALKLPSGCTTVDTLLVRLHENITAYVPNVFTPNGDGQNDRLMPNLVGLKKLNFFRVFNKWGRMLFETTNMGQGWDGKYNGELQPLETYTWSIQGYDANGNMIKRQGSVTLLK